MTPAPTRTAPGEAREEVDVVVLTRDGGPPPGPVRAAIERQGSSVLSINLHIVAGLADPDDRNRWATIVRARNIGRRRGSAPWVMFVDDDVVLGPGCIARLVEGLRCRPDHAALSADYLGDARGGHPGDGGSVPSPHVGMGAVLFRRDVLAFLPFRWDEGRCECRCCASDLRRAGLAIDYLSGAEARHEPSLTGPPAAPGAERGPDRPPVRRPDASSPRILAAFNRAHYRKFVRLFLTTLRRSGNPEPVTAYAFGLLPSEQRRLARTPGVEAVCRPDVGISPAVSRLRDFAEAVARWPGDTPVAYWDAGDVVFQARLAPLWGLVRAHPDRLLAAREAFGLVGNALAAHWVLSIADRRARQFAFDRFSTSPYLNSGFAAGTARAMLSYFREADRLLHSPALEGSTDWGDQTALNLYCHTDPSRWHEVPRGWNYALCRMRPGDFHVSGDGIVVSQQGMPIPVAHGNASMLPHFDLSHLHD